MKNSSTALAAQCAKMKLFDSLLARRTGVKLLITKIGDDDFSLNLWGALEDLTQIERIISEKYGSAPILADQSQVCNDKVNRQSIGVLFHSCLELMAAIKVVGATLRCEFDAWDLVAPSSFITGTEGTTELGQFGHGT